jgi:hypothetical protein
MQRLKRLPPEETVHAIERMKSALNQSSQRVPCNLQAAFGHKMSFASSDSLHSSQSSNSQVVGTGPGPFEAPPCSQSGGNIRRPFDVPPSSTSQGAGTRPRPFDVDELIANLAGVRDFTARKNHANHRAMEQQEVVRYSSQSSGGFRGAAVPNYMPDLENVPHPSDVPPLRLGSRPSAHLEASDSSNLAMGPPHSGWFPESSQVVVRNEPSIHGAARGKAKAKTGVRFATPLPPGPVSVQSLASSVSDVSSASDELPRQPKVIPPGIQTLVVRNIPARITPSGLLDIWPPIGMYNFLHMPYSYRHRRTVGCVFINFVSHGAAVAFTQAWDGKFIINDSNTKKLDISIAEIQGYDDNLMHMRCSKKVMRMRNTRYLPLIILDDGSIANFRQTMASIVPPSNMVQVEDESDDEDASISETQQSLPSSETAASLTQQPRRNARARRN